MKSLLLASCILAPGPLLADSGAILGKIGSIELNSSDFRASLAGLDPAQQAEFARQPSAIGPYVRSYLIQQLILKQAVDEKWDQKPAVISKLVRAREAALSESYLQSASEPDPAYPSEDELKETYKSNKAKFLIPRSYRLAQIFVAGDSDDAAAKKKLEKIATHLKSKDADFSSIARATSEEVASAAQGGEIGWLADAQIQPEIRRQIPEMKLNMISEPIRLADGWHIIKVLDIREAHTQPLSQLRKDLIARMRAELAAQKRREFIENLLEEHPLAINEIELNTLLDETVR